MTSTEMYTMISGLIGKDVTDSDADIVAYLAVAQDKIMSRLYPFGTTLTEVPAKYQPILCELAARQYIRAGAEGQTVSVENGVHRHYESVDDADILERLTPYAKVM